ncbi:PREDICTED: coiled-coil domain-containing protein 112-like [Acromyrmex echinatior]|nr:PREDICTED: coiled-coil domain-containing protein 112-like [Acromyrmex echinatior]
MNGVMKKFMDEITKKLQLAQSVTNYDEKDKKEKQISHGKVRSAESTKYRKSLLKLKEQEYLIEKNLTNFMENMKLESEILRPILRNMNDISRNREIFLDNIKKSLDKITEELQLVQSITNCPEQIQKLDTNAYKQRLLKLSQKIRNFQESCQQKIATLSQEQTALESELREFESNLHKYEDTISRIGKPTSAMSANKENKRCYNYKKIEDLHELIAKTGYTDNWSNEDHLLFLKMRKKCSSIPALVAAIRVKCPDLTAETIVNHEAWYKIYLRLREKQRSSIREWRKQKEMEKMKMKNREDETESETLEKMLREKSNSNITKDFPTCVTDKMRTTKTDNSIDINNQKKELIKQWKAERENKRLLEEEQSRILIESKLAAQEKRKRERLERLRKVLAEHREKTSMEVSSEVSKDDSRPYYNPMLIKAFRKQDAEFTRKKKNLIAVRKSDQNRTIKIVRPQIAKKQDHSTLLNSTEVWREKCRIPDPNTKESKKLQYIKDVPRLYVQWRNKESMEIKDALTFL